VLANKRKLSCNSPELDLQARTGEKVRGFFPSVLLRSALAVMNIVQQGKILAKFLPQSFE